MASLPESRPCEFCMNNGQTISMSLRFINNTQAIYICETCDEVYPDDGNPIEGDLNNQALTESDLKQIGLPTELLEHFPAMKLEFANNITKVLNSRWRKDLNKLWQDFMEINDKINEDESRKMVYTKKDSACGPDKNGDYLFDVSSISEEDFKEINHVLDIIENKNKCSNDVWKKQDEVCSIGTSDFFKKYDEIQGQSVYANKGKDIMLDNMILKKKEKIISMKEVAINNSVLYAKYPELYNVILHGAQASTLEASLPTRITKASLSKMIERKKI